LKCVVLEAGPSPRRAPPDGPIPFETATKRLLQIDEEAWRFRTTGLPYDWIRVRALGGRSLLWGGWCERMDAQNLHDAEALGSRWPISLEELAPYYRAAERRLRVRKGRIPPFFNQVTQKLGLGVAPKRAALVAAKTRPLSGLDLPRPSWLRTQAVARRLIAANGRIHQVEISDGRTHKTEILSANAIVLCASPIESARLLLASGLQGESGQVGRNLVDHLVATCLAILPHPAPNLGPLGPLDRAALLPRFVNLGRRQRRDYRSGFTLELVGPIALTQLGPSGIRGLGFDIREAKNLSYCLVHAIGEAHPHERRFVNLDAREPDSLGRPVPVVHLAWSKEQCAMANDMDETVAAAADALAPPDRRIVRFREALRPGGTAHEAGTARMGANAREGVADSHGAVFGVRGLYIADASVMPTALDRHPTLTLLALALRTADRIAQDARHGF
jgi:choline dehydrogenase-like flavoprotein